MREACIILPFGGTEKDYHAHDTLIASVVDLFGGLTVTNGYGRRKDNDGNVVAEPVQVYTFATHEDDNAYADVDFTIDQLAEVAARELGQKAVYVRYPNGDVRIIDLP